MADLGFMPGALPEFTQAVQVPDIGYNMLGFQRLSDAATESVQICGPIPFNGLPGTMNLIAIANKSNCIVIGGPNELLIHPLANLRATVYNAKSRIEIQTSLRIALPFQPYIIRVTCDESKLVVALRNGAVVVWDINGLIQGTNANPNQGASVPALPGGTLVVDILPNPSDKPGYVAILYAPPTVNSNAGIRIWDVNACAIVAELSGPYTSISWSPKGKQFVVGMTDGRLWQYTPNGEFKAQVPAPSCPGPLQAVSVTWITNTLFLTTYARQIAEADQNVVTLVHHDPKQPPTSWWKFGDICSPWGIRDRPVARMNVPLYPWSPFNHLVVHWSAQSADVSLIASLPQEVLPPDAPRVPPHGFVGVTLEENGMLTMPLSGDSLGDTGCLGLGIDVMANGTIPQSSEGDGDLPASPIVWVITADGLLMAYWLKNKKNRAPYPGMNGVVPATNPVPNPAAKVNPLVNPLAGTAFGQPSPSPWGGSRTLVKPVATDSVFKAFGQVANALASSAAVPGGAFGGGLGPTPVPAGQSIFDQNAGSGMDFDMSGLEGQAAVLGTLQNPSTFPTAQSAFPTQQSAFGATPAPTPFGQQTQQPYSAFAQPYGSQPTNAFGQPQTQTQMGAFGQPIPTSGPVNAFGGSSAPQQGWGQPAVNQPAPFSQPANAFGQPQSSGLGAFGQPIPAAPTAQPTSAFGQMSDMSSSIMMESDMTDASGPSQPADTTNPFTQPAGGISGFGQQTGTQPAANVAAAGPSTGATSTSPFGAPAPTSAFVQAPTAGSVATPSTTQATNPLKAATDSMWARTSLPKTQSSPQSSQTDPPNPLPKLASPQSSQTNPPNPLPKLSSAPTPPNPLPKLSADSVWGKTALSKVQPTPQPSASPSAQPQSPENALSKAADDSILAKTVLPTTQVFPQPAAPPPPTPAVQSPSVSASTSAAQSGSQGKPAQPMAASSVASVVAAVGVPTSEAARKMAAEASAAVKGDNQMPLSTPKASTSNQRTAAPATAATVPANKRDQSAEAPKANKDQAPATPSNKKDDLPSVSPAAAEDTSAFAAFGGGNAFAKFKDVKTSFLDGPQQKEEWELKLEAKKKERGDSPFVIDNSAFRSIEHDIRAARESRDDSRGDDDDDDDNDAEVNKRASRFPEDLGDSEPSKKEISSPAATNDLLSAATPGLDSLRFGGSVKSDKDPASPTSSSSNTDAATPKKTVQSTAPQLVPSETASISTTPAGSPVSSTSAASAPAGSSTKAIPTSGLAALGLGLAPSRSASFAPNKSSPLANPPTSSSEASPKSIPAPQASTSGSSAGIVSPAEPEGPLSTSIHGLFSLKKKKSASSPAPVGEVGTKPAEDTKPKPSTNAQPATDAPKPSTTQAPVSKNEALVALATKDAARTPTTTQAVPGALATAKGLFASPKVAEPRDSPAPVVKPTTASGSSPSVSNQKPPAKSGSIGKEAALDRSPALSQFQPPTYPEKGWPGAVPEFELTPQAPPRMKKEGIPAEFHKIYATLSAELQQLQDSVATCRAYQDRLQRPSVPGLQADDLQKPENWTFGDLPAFRDMLKEAEADATKLKDQSLIIKRWSVEMEAMVLRAETKSEEARRFVRARQDGTSASFLKVRHLGPEHSETQSQLRKSYQSIYRRLQQLEDHVVSLKAKVQQDKQGAKLLKPPTLDTINRTIRQISDATTLQVAALDSMQDRINNLALSPAAIQRSTLTGASNRNIPSPLRPVPAQDSNSSSGQPRVPLDDYLLQQRSAGRLKKALLEGRSGPLRNLAALRAKPMDDAEILETDLSLTIARGPIKQEFPSKQSQTGQLLNKTGPTFVTAHQPPKASETTLPGATPFAPSVIPGFPPAIAASVFTGKPPASWDAIKNTPYIQPKSDDFPSGDLLPSRRKTARLHQSSARAAEEPTVLTPEEEEAKKRVASFDWGFKPTLPASTLPFSFDSFKKLPAAIQQSSTSNAQGEAKSIPAKEEAAVGPPLSGHLSEAGGSTPKPLPFSALPISPLKPSEPGQSTFKVVPFSALPPLPPYKPSTAGQSTFNTVPFSALPIPPLKPAEPDQSTVKTVPVSAHPASSLKSPQTPTNAEVVEVNAREKTQTSDKPVEKSKVSSSPVKTPETPLVDKSAQAGQLLEKTSPSFASMSLTSMKPTVTPDVNLTFPSTSTPLASPSSVFTGKPPASWEALKNTPYVPPSADESGSRPARRNQPTSRTHQTATRLAEGQGPSNPNDEEARRKVAAFDWGPMAVKELPKSNLPFSFDSFKKPHSETPPTPAAQPQTEEQKDAAPKPESAPKPVSTPKAEPASKAESTSSLPSVNVVSQSETKAKDSPVASLVLPAVAPSIAAASPLTEKLSSSEGTGPTIPASNSTEAKNLSPVAGTEAQVPLTSEVAPKPTPVTAEVKAATAVPADNAFATTKLAPGADQVKPPWEVQLKATSSSAEAKVSPTVPTDNVFATTKLAPGAERVKPPWEVTTKSTVSGPDAKGPPAVPSGNVFAEMKLSATALKVKPPWEVPTKSAFAKPEEVPTSPAVSSSSSHPPAQKLGAFGVPLPQSPSTSTPSSEPIGAFGVPLSVLNAGKPPANLFSSGFGGVFSAFARPGEFVQSVSAMPSVEAPSSSTPAKQTSYQAPKIVSAFGPGGKGPPVEDKPVYISTPSESNVRRPMDTRQEEEYDDEGDGEGDPDPEYDENDGLGPPPDDEGDLGGQGYGWDDEDEDSYHGRIGTHRLGTHFEDEEGVDDDDFEVLDEQPGQ